MKWVAVSTIISAAINLLLNYLFIPKWGIIGAAFATYISYVFLFLMHELVARKIIGGYNIRFLNYVPGIVAVNILAIVSNFLVEYWLIRYALLAIFVFSIVLYILKNKKNTILNVIRNS